jgi:transcription-repair coupling factor (superfamily II helicase)
MGEMKDRFGEVPDEVVLLGELMMVKALARRLAAMSVDLTAERLTLALDEKTPLRPDKVLALVNKKGSAYKVTPDMRLVRQFQGPEKQDRVRTARRVLLELAALV